MLSGKAIKVDQLKDFCRWKKQPGDRPLPTKNADIAIRFNTIKGNQLSHVSPFNSDIEFDGEDGGNIDTLNTDANTANNNGIRNGKC